MTTPARRRLMRDFVKIQKEKPRGIGAKPNENNVMQWKCMIFGPEGTIWESGVFPLEMVFSEEYPNKPPSVQFLVKMFHPNIYQDGKICLDMLQSQWSPLYDVFAILTCIRSLLTDPNPNSPANAEAAKMYVEDRKAYELRVKEVVESSWDDDE